VLINTSPEPVSNWTASFSEDILVITGIWAALNHPWVFLAGLFLFVLLMIWLLPKILIGIKRMFGFIKSLFGAKAKPKINENPDLPLPHSDN